MKSIFKRVLFCKIHCPSFIYFRKPSAAAHLYNPGPLKSDNTLRVPCSSVEPVTSNSFDNVSSNDELSGETIEVKDGNCLELDEQTENALKSCMRNTKEVEKKRVQWVDNLGKELADIQEFESSCHHFANSEAGDIEYNEDSTRGCICVIL